MLRIWIATVTSLCVLISGCATLGVTGGGPITQRFEKLEYFTGKATESVEQAYACMAQVAGLEEELEKLEQRLETCQTEEEKESIKVEINKKKEEAMQAAQQAAEKKQQLTEDQKKLVRETWINLGIAAVYYAEYISKEAPALLAEAQQIAGSAQNPAIAMRYAGDIPNLPKIIEKLQATMQNVSDQPVLIAKMMIPLADLAMANGVELPKKEEVAEVAKKELSKGIK